MLSKEKYTEIQALLQERECVVENADSFHFDLLSLSEDDGNTLIHFLKHEWDVLTGCPFCERLLIIRKIFPFEIPHKVRVEKAECVRK